MSHEVQGADAHVPMLSSNSNNSIHAKHACVLLQHVDDEVHQALDAFESDSAESLRSLIVPAHVPIIIGSILKVRNVCVLSLSVAGIPILMYRPTRVTLLLTIGVT